MGVTAQPMRLGESRVQAATTSMSMTYWEMMSWMKRSHFCCQAVRAALLAVAFMALYLSHGSSQCCMRLQADVFIITRGAFRRVPFDIISLKAACMSTDSSDRNQWCLYERFWLKRFRVKSSVTFCQGGSPDNSSQDEHSHMNQKEETLQVYPGQSTT